MTILLFVLGILSISFLVVMLIFYYDFMSEFSSSETKYKISFKQFYEWYKQNKKSLSNSECAIGFYHIENYHYDIELYLDTCNIYENYYYFSFSDFVQYELCIIWNVFFDKYRIDKSKFVDKTKGENPLMRNTK